MIEKNKFHITNAKHVIIKHPGLRFDHPFIEKRSVTTMEVFDKETLWFPDDPGMLAADRPVVQNDFTTRMATKGRRFMLKRKCSRRETFVSGSLQVWNIQGTQGKVSPKTQNCQSPIYLSLRKLFMSVNTRKKFLFFEVESSEA